MSENQLKSFTSNKQYPIGELRTFGNRTLVQLRRGPNQAIFEELKLQKFANYEWEVIRSIVKQKTLKLEYNNLFWDSYYGYKPINRILHIDAGGNFYFKFEKEWKRAIKSNNLGHLAKCCEDNYPTIHEKFGLVYCFYAEVTGATR